MHALATSFVAAATTPLVILNLVLGAACAVCVAAVAIAAYLDLREKRRWRAMVPPCWPPPGVDPRDAYADADLASPSAAGPRTSSSHGRTT